jgi:hypothetical protein
LRRKNEGTIQSLLEDKKNKARKSFATDEPELKNSCHLSTTESHKK